MLVFSKIISVQGVLVIAVQHNTLGIVNAVKLFALSLSNMHSNKNTWEFHWPRTTHNSKPKTVGLNLTTLMTTVKQFLSLPVVEPLTITSNRLGRSTKEDETYQRTKSTKGRSLPCVSSVFSPSVMLLSSQAEALTRYLHNRRRNFTTENREIWSWKFHGWYVDGSLIGVERFKYSRIKHSTQIKLPSTKIIKIYLSIQKWSKYTICTKNVCSAIFKRVFCSLCFYTLTHFFSVTFHYYKKFKTSFSLSFFETVYPPF